MNRYEWLVQVHGEWSGIPDYDWMDIDFECDSEKRAREIIRTEVPKGVPYILYHGEFLVEEGIGV